MSPDESSRPSRKQVSGTVVRSDQPTFTCEQEQKYRWRYEEGFDLPDEEYEARLKISHPGQTTTGNISTQVIACLATTYMYVDDDGKSAGQVGASSGMQPMNSPLSSVEWEMPTFSIVEEWKFVRLYKEGCDLPDEKYKAWLKINHREDTRAGNNSYLQ